MHQPKRLERHLEGERFKIKTCNRFSKLEIEEPTMHGMTEDLQPPKKLKRKRTSQDQCRNKNHGKENIEYAKKKTKTKSMSMKRMKNNAKQIEQTNSFKKLKKDHYSFKKQFLSLAWKRCPCRKQTCRMLIQKAEPIVERANVWIKHRGNSTGYPKLVNGIPIILKTTTQELGGCSERQTANIRDEFQNQNTWRQRTCRRILYNNEGNDEHLLSDPSNYVILLGNMGYRPYFLCENIVQLNMWKILVICQTQI